MHHKFLPIAKEDLKERGWSRLDIVLITGDAYVDHPSYAAAVIGRVLADAGFKVGIIAQPDWKKSDDFLKLGKPRLFFGITAGNLDSILSNYTANRKLRRKDEYSPGGKMGLRPNRATIVYANKIKELFPDVQIVIGGIEASLRRLAHYDWWSDEVRHSILLDAKADILVYGMGEKQVVEIATRLSNGENIEKLDDIRGTAVIRRNIQGFKGYVTIPSFEEVRTDKDKFNAAFRIAYLECDPFTGKTVIQKYADRFLVQLPPALPLTTKELDRIYELDYARTWHPVYDKDSGVPGFETVRFSIISHRGCCGECSFCSLYAHQGRIIQSRSIESVVREVRRLADQKYFHGTITDIGGPTANLYQAECELWKKTGACRNKICLLPNKCNKLKLGYEKTLSMWGQVMKIPKVKHVFIGSGLRYDLLLDKSAQPYLLALCKDHIGGQLKVAPEHTIDSVLRLMNKSPFRVYEEFAQKFMRINENLHKKQFLVNYFISAHPGSTLHDSRQMSFDLKNRHIHPEQIQDFIPLPMTVSSAMYYTAMHPFTGEKIYIPRSFKERKMQRAFIQYKQPKNKRLIAAALSSPDVV